MKYEEAKLEKYINWSHNKIYEYYYEKSYKKIFLGFLVW